MSFAGRSLLAAMALLGAGAAGAAEQSVGDQFAIAIEGGDILAVRALVEGGAAPDTSIEYGNHKITPLAKASWDGRRDIVKYLLSKGAKVNARASDDQSTPLHQAVMRGYDDIVGLLLQAGADAKASDGMGNTPFSAATFNGQLDIAETLVKAGADPDAAYTAGLTPLMTAAHMGNLEVLRFLVRLGASVNKVSQLEYGGQTPLTSAVGSGQVESVRELLALGADPHLKMKSGATALSLAKESGNQEVLALIEAALAKPRPRPRARPASKP